MTSPFDDREFQEALAEMGLGHEPGMAAKMLEDLAPLLAGEGLDLDDPESFRRLGLGDLNEAFAQSTERLNTELFTPVGAERDRGLAALCDFTLDLVGERWDDAREVLDGVPSEPTAVLPSAAHMIGTVLGFLDEWYSAAEFPEGVTAVRIPSWDDEDAREAARDILAEARAGNSFGSLTDLHRLNDGTSILGGGALLFAATMAAIAADQDRPVRETLREMFGDDVVAEPEEDPNQGTEPESEQAPSGEFAWIALPDIGESPILQRFGQWLERQSQEEERDARDELEFFEGVVYFAASAGLDVHVPQDMELIVDSVLGSDNAEDPGLLGFMLRALDDYVHFRLAAPLNVPQRAQGAGPENALAHQQADPSAWHEAHQVLEKAMADGGLVGTELADALNAAESVDPGRRLEAVAKLPIVSGIGELLTWIGKGRRVTSAGNLVRADIGFAAGLLGIDAVGVNKRPVPDEDDDSGTLHVQSMSELPMLASWWETLQVTELIQVSGSKVRLGDIMQAWWAAGEDQVRLLESFVGLFIAQHCIQDAQNDFLVGPDATLTNQIILLKQMMQPNPGDEVRVPSPEEPLLTTVTRIKLHALDDTGLWTVRDGVRFIPEELHGAVGMGIAMLAAYRSQLEEFDL